jgi:hypothetical protein
MCPVTGMHHTSARSFYIFAKSKLHKYYARFLRLMWLNFALPMQFLQVLIRIRPISDAENAAHGQKRCLMQDSSKSLSWTGHPETMFTFDHVACETISQVSCVLALFSTSFWISLHLASTFVYSGKAVQSCGFANGGELHVWVQWLFVCLRSGKTNLHFCVTVEEFI